MAATGTPVALAMIKAGPVDLSWAKDHIPAIVWGGYGGQSGGQALVDVLVGTVNPGGALPYTVYPQHFADITPFADMGIRPNATSGNPGRSYRFLDTKIIKPLWPFGWGGSYSASFTVSWDLPGCPPGNAPAGLGDTTSWAVRVQNAPVGSGGVTGDVVVTCYVAAVKQNAVSDPPVKSLFDFTRVVGLEPGAERLVTFTLTPRDRSLYNEAGERVTPVGTFSVECEAGGQHTTGPRPLIIVGGE